jgi:UDP-N-acetylmuramoyl-tripeptide--D-alanyl-D-alanine ligase
MAVVMITIRELARQVREYIRRKKRRALARRAAKRRDTLANVRFVAITGSAGKTTTTRLLGRIATRHLHAYVAGGHNTQEAIVTTILELPPDYAICVHEVSGHEPGAVSTSCALLRPEIGIVTSVGTDHRSNYRTLEATAAEKGMLVECLPPHGVAILNADDPHVRAMASRTAARVVTYGIDPQAQLRAENIVSAWPEQLSFTLVAGDRRLAVRTRMYGAHWVTPVLAAIAGGVALGVDLAACIEVVEGFEPVFQRYSSHRFPSGAAVILDTEKAPWWTLAAGLRFVAEAKAARKTIVFGTVSDYPGAAGARYRGIAREALKIADRVIFIGRQSGRAAKLQQEVASGRLLIFATVAQAHAYLSRNTHPDELLYMKASSTDHLERLVVSYTQELSCWIEGCGKRYSCRKCRNVRRKRGVPPALEPASLA